MKASKFVCIFAFLALSAHADLVYERPGLSVGLTTKPCPADLQYLIERDDMRDGYFEARGVENGQPVRACAALVTYHKDPSQPYIHVVYEDGTQGIIPFVMFAPTQRQDT